MDIMMHLLEVSLEQKLRDKVKGYYLNNKPPGFLRKHKNPLIAGGLAAGVGGAMLYKRMKNKKVQESASSGDFATLAGPIPMDKRAIRGAKSGLNLRKAKKKLKELHLKQGD